MGVLNRFSKRVFFSISIVDQFLFCCCVFFQELDITFAVQTFAAKRHGGIYKQEYIDDLFQRYGDGDEPLQVFSEFRMMLSRLGGIFNGWIHYLDD